MRRLFLSTILLSMTSLMPVAGAQNYVAPHNYNNPDVVVNMDVLGASGPGGLQPAPVYQRPLPPLAPPQALAPPLRLNPPRPMASAVAPLAAPPVASMVAPRKEPAPLPPVAAAPEPRLAEINDEMLPPPKPAARPSVRPAPFLAGDLAAMAPPSAPPVPAPVAEPVPVKQADSRGRTLLAQAREDAANDQDNQGKRDVVLFDKAPNTERPLTAPQAAKPVLSAPAEELAPPAMPAPITPKSEQKVAMLTPVPVAKPAANQSAMTSASTTVDDFEAYRLLFDGTSTEMKPAERNVLNGIVKKLQSDANLRLQLRAYANGTPDTASQARRVSLGRALAVRNALVQQGVAATRLDVRALGMGSADMNDQVGKNNIPADRVDLVLVR